MRFHTSVGFITNTGELLKPLYEIGIADILGSGWHRDRDFGGDSIQSDHGKRLRLMLAALDTSTTVEDMDIPGYRLHALKGKLKGRWSVTVSGNWRLTFEFENGNVELLDYEDYH